MRYVHELQLIVVSRYSAIMAGVVVCLLSFCVGLVFMAWLLGV
jgi:hypothetical protein